MWWQWVGYSVVRSNHSTSQHHTTWWSDQTIPPVNTIPHGSHIRPFHRSTLYHMVVRSDHSTSQHHTTWWSDQTIPPVITVPHGGQIRPFHQSTPYHMVVRSKACRTVNEGQGLLPYIYLSAGPSINGDASSLWFWYMYISVLQWVIMKIRWSVQVCIPVYRWAHEATAFQNKPHGEAIAARADQHQAKARVSVVC